MAEILETRTAAMRSSTTLPSATWTNLIPAEQWGVLQGGSDAMDQAGAPFLLTDALAFATYTGHWRNTKDIEVIIHRNDRDRAIEALRRVGFADYFEREAYDQSGAFRGFRNGSVLNVVWVLPNPRVTIDEPWFEQARRWRVHERTYLVVPVEELIRSKLYVMRRECCDWGDVLNLFAVSVEEICWPRLVDRMGRDLPLLHAALAIFNWMCPGRAHALPAWLRKQFALPRVECQNFRVTEQRRVRLIDSRPWFALHEPVDRPLER